MIHAKQRQKQRQKQKQIEHKARCNRCGCVLSRYRDPGEKFCAPCRDADSHNAVRLNPRPQHYTLCPYCRERWMDQRSKCCRNCWQASRTLCIDCDRPVAAEGQRRCALCRRRTERYDSCPDCGGIKTIKSKRCQNCYKELRRLGIIIQKPSHISIKSRPRLKRTAP